MRNEMLMMLESTTSRSKISSYLNIPRWLCSGMRCKSHPSDSSYDITMLAIADDSMVDTVYRLEQTFT